jgi:hypothetical protein
MDPLSYSRGSARLFALCFLTLFMLGLTLCHTTFAEQYPADSSRWNLYGGARVGEFEGRPGFSLTSGVAELKDVEMRDGILDVDVFTNGKRAFFGFDFRIDSVDYEEVYLRAHKSGLPDAMQYTPVLRTGRNWQLYNGPGFTGAIDIPMNRWFHLRLVVTGAQAKLYVGDTIAPALVMDDLKSGVRKGTMALYTLAGPVYFSNFSFRPTPDAPWVRHLPAMDPHTIKNWSLSPSFDALARDVERPLSKQEVDTMKWQEVEAEPPGVVVIQRYRDAPHPNVTFQSDFSTRLQPQPGTQLVYARTEFVSDRDEVRKLYIGYSDEVTLFLNGEPIFRGRSAQGFRDPGFLGIVYPEDDAVYLHLKKGKNELVLALSELGGGWGFVCRWGEAER